MTFIIGRSVKFVGTAAVEIDEMRLDKVVVRLKNHRKVQNHIGGIHAAATALLGETASGLVTGMNVADDCVPLLKSMKIDYTKVASGDLVAEASLTGSQQQQIYEDKKGEITIEVIVTDSKGNHPVNSHFTWAWVPKKKSA